MPTYDYCCDTCKYRFEFFQYITAEPLKKCPNCGFRMLRRLIGKGSGVIFKGQGWPGQEIARGETKHEEPQENAST